MESEILCLGMSVVDLLISGIEKETFSEGDIIAESMNLATGGDALNQAVVLSKLNRSVGLITSVGKDYFGEFLTDFVSTKTQIAESQIIKGDYSTSMSVVLIAEGGERRFIKTLTGSVDEFSLEAIDPRVFSKKTQILSIGSLGGSKKMVGEELADFLKLVKSQEIQIVADMVDNLGEKTYESIVQALPYIDYFVPSEDEVRLMFGTEDIGASAQKLLELGAKNVVIKLGSKGVLCKNQTIEKYLLPARVPVVDTTGAGDNFVAGFNFALLEGQSLENAAKFGMATSAVSIQSIGAISENYEINRITQIAKQIEENDKC